MLVRAVALVLAALWGRAGCAPPLLPPVAERGVVSLVTGGGGFRPPLLATRGDNARQMRVGPSAPLLEAGGDTARSVVAGASAMFRCRVFASARMAGPRPAAVVDAGCGSPGCKCLSRGVAVPVGRRVGAALWFVFAAPPRGLDYQEGWPVLVLPLLPVMPLTGKRRDVRWCLP